MTRFLNEDSGKLFKLFSGAYFMELSNERLENYMLRCVELAKKTPFYIRYPHVGALVLSPDDTIIGEGYKHFIKGTRFLVHAERMALESVSFRYSQTPKTLVRTLEPCVPPKRGKRPLFSSCCELILRNRE